MIDGTECGNFIHQTRDLVTHRVGLDASFLRELRELSPIRTKFLHAPGELPEQSRLLFGLYAQPSNFFCQRKNRLVQALDLPLFVLTFAAGSFKFSLCGSQCLFEARIFFEELRRAALQTFVFTGIEHFAGFFETLGFSGNVALGFGKPPFGLGARLTSLRRLELFHSFTMNRLRRSALKVDQPVMQPIMRSRSFTRGVLNLVERFRFGFYGAKRCLYTLLGPLSLDLHFFTRPPEIGLSALPDLPRTAGFPFFKHEFGRAALELNDLALQHLGTPTRIGFGFLRSRTGVVSGCRCLVKRLHLMRKFRNFPFSGKDCQARIFRSPKGNGRRIDEVPLRRHQCASRRNVGARCECCLERRGEPDACGPNVGRRSRRRIIGLDNASQALRRPFRMRMSGSLCGGRKSESCRRARLSACEPGSGTQIAQQKSACTVFEHRFKRGCPGVVDVDFVNQFRQSVQSLVLKPLREAVRLQCLLLHGFKRFEFCAQSLNLRKGGKVSLLGVFGAFACFFCCGNSVFAGSRSFFEHFADFG